ncbi:MAG: efflux RND transporter periplasmic adaptor subunit [Paludibacter sp.]|nr:efflux RND transporter periplasmic adaptor subunit [Paludibacter sp.]
MKKTILFTLTVLSLVGCNNKPKVESPTSPQVVLAEVVKVNGATDLHYSGSIEAFQTIPLAFQSTGTVLTVLVNAGDVVRKGQLLATVDKADALSMYEVANAKYKQAKDAYNRLKEVHDNGSLSEIKWVEMESNLEQAKSSVAMAKNNLNKCALYSPDNGIIGSRNIEPGMSALGNPISPLELVKIESVYVKISVPENEIGKIQKGQKATFKVSALENKVFEGVITSVGVVADQISRTYEVKMLVKNPGLLLKPGMVCDVNLGITTNKEVVVVPYQAVDQDKDNNSFVYVVDPAQKTAQKRIIHTENYLNSSLEVVDGLAVGEKVVCEGKQKLSDNCKVTL